MLNIKGIALKVAGEIYDVNFDEHKPSGKRLISFAEALVTEIAKQNKPVAYATTSEDGDMAMLFFDDGEARKYSGDDAPIKLYTIPPTAEQIANETAEAIAKMLESGSFLSTESKIALAANGAAKAIRRGAWKEFKK